jgi:hypothetical protein
VVVVGGEKRGEKRGKFWDGRRAGSWKRQIDYGVRMATKMFWRWARKNGTVTTWDRVNGPFFFLIKTRISTPG